MLVPLFGFLEGDTLGILVLCHDEETVGDLMRKLLQSSNIRVGPPDPESRAEGQFRVLFRKSWPPPHLTIQEVGMEALDRFDVRWVDGNQEEADHGVS